MILSVVTGTYNRIAYLQSMVNSARISVGVGMSYEIVVVDGGSTDGTLDWCKKQPDIRLIEHGQLLGAVKAFNDGAYAALGEYVILANDDIMFIDESIQTAIAFMQNHPDVGIGCLYQDRGNKPWHVEIMTGMLNKKSTNLWYGQVCILPKWLGDRVGWWGDYLRTYGGDNELSCNVYEYGYQVRPIDCACIHDLTPGDELRKINNPAGPSGDSAKWYNKWFEKGKRGPVVRLDPAEPNPIVRNLRIVYAPIYEPGHSVQKVQKHGLRDALAKVGLVTEVDYVKDGFGKVFDVACAFDPDIILTQLQDKGVGLEAVLELRREYPRAKLINWNGDYHPENIANTEYLAMCRLYDLCGFVTTQYKDLWGANGIPWFYWQIGYEPSCAEPDANTPKHDIVFLANGYSEKRILLAKFLRTLPYNVGIYGSWPKEVKANGYNLYDFDAGSKLYKRAKIAIGDTQWAEAAGFVSNRLFQAMAAGVCYCQQYVDGLDELLGLEDQLDYIGWEGLEDLEYGIRMLMDYPDIRANMAKNGMEKVSLHHSFDARVAQLLAKLNVRC